jgi:hypothetical protein
MSKTKTSTVDDLAECGKELAVAESLVEQLRLRRDTLLLQAREEDPTRSLQFLADLAGMRREAAHYAVLRAQARRGENA